MISTRPYKSEFPLTDAEKQYVLLRIYSQLGRLSPEVVSPKQAKTDGGLQNLEQHLDEIIDVVHRSSANHIEPYIAQFFDDVCARCPHQEPCGHCPLRSAASCVLFRFPQTIVAAVQDGLRSVEAARQRS